MYFIFFYLIVQYLFSIFYILSKSNKNITVTSPSPNTY